MKFLLTDPYKKGFAGNLPHTIYCGTILTVPDYCQTTARFPIWMLDYVKWLLDSAGWLLDSADWQLDAARWLLDNASWLLDDF
jgi:hypothetical protein